MPIVKLENGTQLKFDDSYTDDQIGQAVDEYMAGEVQPFNQQESAPTPQASKELPLAEKEQANYNNYAPQRAEIKREIGLGTRAALQGVGNVATFPYDLASLGVNALFGTKIKPGSSVVSEGLSSIGLPEAKTSGEKVVSAAIEAGTSAGGFARGIKSAAENVPKFLKRFSSGNVAVDTAAGATAGAGVKATEEAGFGPLTQLAVGLASGSVGGSVASKIAKIKPPVPELLSDVKERGIDETQAFGKVRSSIEKEATKQNKEVGKLFNSAIKDGQGAFIAKQDLENFSQNLRSGVKNEIDIDGKNLITRTADVIDGFVTGPESAQSINELQSIRRSATRISSKGLPSSNAAGDLVRKIDGFLDEVQIQGDENAAGLWKSAIGKSREYYKKFEDPKKIAGAIDSDQTLETIEKSFLGSGPVSNQKDLAKTYRETLNAVDPTKQKEVGFAMRQSALNRIIKDAARVTDSKEGLSASRLSNSIRNLRRENTSFWSEFTPDEKKIISQLENQLRKASEGGVVNKVYSAFEKIVSKGLRSNVELPRTLKSKTVVTVDDLLELISTRPKTTKAAPLTAISQSIQQENN